MGAENLEKILAALVLFFFLVVGPAAGEGRATTWAIKPYRALLIVDRWSDPTSMLVDHEKDDFQPVAALLKAWSVPFDILRLDQQHLDNTYLLERPHLGRRFTFIYRAESRLAGRSGRGRGELAGREVALP